MIIGSVVFEIHIPYAGSLKEKRMVVRSVKEKLKSKFNVSVSEIGDLDKWQSAQVAVVTVAPDRKQAEKVVQNVINFVENNYPDIHINVYKELI
ncbi:MAG TPA: DUF503 domain-containing protein [Persephonella sp.]|uniref:YlxP n=1 Tax=Persephonella marina (strain DSM 14350 / EX-H1) TaxID=123214 RepID=C0QU20_PERMH|nr:MULTISPECIES: DUF503 domain-containing protein [Persephonella]ACO03853.1 YlxP [Persephonella marina EX-H1]HCB70198.1 DUF503 domain-containing protein [Persephonella sp.]